MMRFARIAKAVCICIGAFTIATDGRAADLASCADKYGRLMADHWITVSTLQQVERLLFYSGALSKDGPQTVRFWEVRDSVADAKRSLDDASRRYAVLFKSPTKEGTEALDAALKKAAAAVERNEANVNRLLNDAGKRVAGNSFSPEPIGKADIEPRWDSRLIDEHYRPKRTLFGSTGQVGDDRTLPLKFDFASGMYSFHVNMTARDKLDVGKTESGWTDARHKWMLDRRMGYHYWAGVYNNNNSYVADWFVKEFGNDDDVWIRLNNGNVTRSAAGGFAQPNIFNPRVRDFMRNYCETQGRYFHDDPSLVCYDYTGEPHPYASDPKTGRPEYGGLNESAIAAFREFLTDKFKTIAELNRAWKSSYKGFDEIKPPPDPYVTLPEKATPLSYEFERFRCKAQTDYWKLVYDGYRKHDAKKPIEAHASMYMSGWPVQAMDAYQMLKTGVADWIDMHQNNFPPNLPEQIYLYSLCKLTGRVPVQFEYIWTFPRTGPFNESNEYDFRATCEASVWRNIVWGKRALVFFDFSYEWPGYRNGLYDKNVGYSILRSSACVVPAIKRQVLRFNEMFLNTEVEDPPIIVMQPSASVWNSPPIHPHDGFSFHTNAAMHVHELLFPRNYPFLYVPEEAVLDDGYNLAKHRVIVLPQAPYLPIRMTDALLAWVRDGGTLICTGIPGIWSPYGETDMRLVNEVFGKSKVDDTEHGRWHWQWQLPNGKPDVEYAIKDGAGNVVTARARYGKGTVLIAANGFDRPDARKRFYDAVDGAIRQRPATCAHDAFELTIRSGKGGRYLCVLNPDTRAVREDEVVVSGNYPGSLDLGVGSGVQVPAKVLDGVTRFKLRLHPGESTVVELKQ
jgi:hypothetical protein